MKKQEILKNQLIQKAQQYFINSPYARGVVFGLKRKLPRLRDCKKGNIEYILIAGSIGKNLSSCVSSVWIVAVDGNPRSIVYKKNNVCEGKELPPSHKGVS
jgi:hypothetical protein